MEIYYFTILIFAIFGFFELLNKDKNIRNYLRVLQLITFLILVFQIGLRWQTGSDWIPYLDHFLSYSRDTVDDGGFEIGYRYFVELFYSISENYSVLLFSHSIIFYLLIFKSYKYFTPYFFLSILFMYVSLMGMVGANRQLLALGIGMISLVYLCEHKYYHYFALVFLAMLFHTTAVLLIVFVILKKRIELKYILVFIILCITIGKTQLPYQIFSLAGSIGDIASDKTETYSILAKETSNVDVSIIGLFRRIGFLFMFLYTRNFIERVNKNYNLLLNGYVVGIGFYFLFYITLPIMISRGSLYFNVLEPILLSLQFYMLKDVARKNIFLLIAIVYSFIMLHQSISTYPDLFDPYKGIFINSDFKRNMH